MEDLCRDFFKYQTDDLERYFQVQSFKLTCSK